MTNTQNLIKFIRESLMVNQEVTELGEDDSLIERGLLDSIGLLQIMTHIEEETGLRVPDDDVLPENFETVRQIDELMTRLQAKRR